MSDSQYIPDSDDDNSLPVLPASAVDITLLRDFYSFLSAGSKARLRTEAENTPFSRLYAQFDETEDNEEPTLHAPAEAGGAQKPTQQPTSILLLDNSRDLPSVDSTNRQPSDLISQVTGSSYLVPHTGPEISVGPSPIPIDDYVQETYNARSLRKRNFSSRHPYIADQADWLGICTVDGINEMFSADEDIIKVLRALNSLYTKRKKRYPDEDRYKAKNFYTHLGKNNLLALQGDPDAQPISSTDGQLDIEIEDDDYNSTSQKEPPDVDIDDEEELIPFEELQMSHHRPRIINDDSLSETHQEPTNDQQSDSQSSEEESEEEYIKIGGRYRKLKTILRGVLPESAKRLVLFQEQQRRTKKRRIDQGIEPRKGLAIRKQGPKYRESVPMQKGLQEFVNDEDLSEEYTPNYLNASEFRTPEYESPLLFQVNTESDYESDSIEEIFARHKDPIVVSKLLDSDFPAPFSESDGDSVQEDDQIDHMFASRDIVSDKKQGSYKKRRNKLSFASRSNKSSPQILNSNRATQRGGISRRSSLSGGKLRSKKYPLLSQSILTVTPQVGEKRNRHSSERGRLLGSHISSISKTKSKDLKVENKTKDDQMKKVQHILPTNPPFRRDPVKSTTAFEVESDSKFVNSHRSRSHFFGQNLPVANLNRGLAKSNSLTPFSTFQDLQRVHTIGDGHIFFANENEVEVHLSGKRYSFGLYKSKLSTKEMESLLAQLRRVLLNLNSLANPHIREQIKLSLILLIKWFLILRENVPALIWRQIRVIFDDLTKLHTREIRLYQSVFHAQLLLIYYIMNKLGPKDKELENYKIFDSYCSEYWSIYFLTFNTDDLSERAPNSKVLLDSIGLLHFVYDKRECSWWYPIMGALDEVGNLNELNSSLLDMSYILASLYPHDLSNWGPFLAIFNKFKGEKLSRDHHHFLDICELVNRKLEWPLEERLITHLYSSLGLRKFGNFTDETAVPQAIHNIHSRHDIPNSTVFERFLCLVYDYVSQLLSQKSVKRFISKLVVSSQYQYEKGRRYQIMFVNRVNLIILLFQISDTDLKNQITNLIEQVKNSKDMFVYGRAVDAVKIFCEIGERKGKYIPWSSFRSLLEISCFNYDTLFGMPNLFKRTVNLIGLKLLSLDKVSEILEAFKLWAVVNIEKFPDPILKDTLRHLAIFCSLVNHKWKSQFTVGSIDLLLEFQRFFVNFLSNLMKRFPLSNTQHENRTDEIIELAIQIWINTCKFTNTHSWNIIMLQKYSYLGNSFLRERFLMFLCLQFLENDTSITKFEVDEIDLIVLKRLCFFELSPYIPRLLSSLSRRPESIFNRKKVSFSDFHSVSQVVTYRAQIVSLVVQSICSSSFNERERKEYLLALVNQLQDVYSMHFGDSNFVDFCKRTMEVILRFTKDNVDDLDIVWEFAAKVGFPRKKKNDSWIKANEQEKLQKANYEFIEALNYNRDFHSVLDDLLTADDLEILYSLIQIYVQAVKINGIYWPHLAYLLKYALAKLEGFQIIVQDVKFKIFLELICDVSMISSRWKNTSYIMFELEALTTIVRVLQRALYIYNGYKERVEVREMVREFLRNMNQPDLSYEPRQLLTTTTFGMLRSVSHRNFNPNFEHSAADYETALAEQDHMLVSLSQMIDDSKNERDSDISMDYEFNM